MAYAYKCDGCGKLFEGDAKYALWRVADFCSKACLAAWVAKLS